MLKVGDKVKVGDTVKMRVRVRIRITPPEDRPRVDAYVGNSGTIMPIAACVSMPHVSSFETWGSKRRLVSEQREGARAEDSCSARVGAQVCHHAELEFGGGVEPERRRWRRRPTAGGVSVGGVASQQLPSWQRHEPTGTVLVLV